MNKCAFTAPKSNTAKNRSSGRSLAHTMLFDSNLKNFAGLLDYTITFYELTNFDEAELGFVRLPDLEDKK